MPEAMEGPLCSREGTFLEGRDLDLSGSQVIPNAGVQWGMVSLLDVAMLLLLSARESRYSWLCSVPLSEGPSRVIHFFCTAQVWPKMLLLLY